MYIAWKVMKESNEKMHVQNKSHMNVTNFYYL